MTDNIPPEIADCTTRWKSTDRVCTRWDLCPLAGQLHSGTPAPAPVRISPEVRELIRQSLYMAAATFPPHTKMAARFAEAIAFVEALP